MSNSDREGVVTLSADATRTVDNNYITIILAVTNSGADSALIQTELREALNQALAVAKPGVLTAQPGTIELETGTFSIGPAFNPKSKKQTHYIGSTSLIIKGVDSQRISQMAAEITSMQIRDIAHSLSPDLKKTVESELTREAIGAFQMKASQCAALFGFNDYRLLTVDVRTQNNGYGRGAQVSAAAVMGGSAPSEPIPIEAGKSTVGIHVSGSIILAQA